VLRGAIPRFEIMAGDGATRGVGVTGGSEKVSGTTDALSRIDFRGAGGGSRIPPDDMPHAAPSGESCPLTVAWDGECRACGNSKKE
jgi:hypothetical protein